MRGGVALNVSPWPLSTLVRGLLGQLAEWHQSIGELGRALTTATEGRPLPGWSLGGELELPATRNGRFRGAAIPEGCAVSDAGRRRCGGHRPVR